MGGIGWELLIAQPLPPHRNQLTLDDGFPLKRFVSCGGQAAFFDAFDWALSAGGRVPIDQGLEYADLPEGTGEFLDAWLMLLEKVPKLEIRIINFESLVFFTLHFAGDPS